MRGTERLSHAPRVGADHDVGEIENLWRRAIVLLEPHDDSVGEIFVEVEDVADVRAPPTVDRLIVVADHADIPMLAAEELDQLVLRAIGVLIFVYQDVFEAAAVALELCG